MATTKKNDWVNMDGALILNMAAFNNFGGDSSYFGICGGVIDGIYQWATHNIDDIEEVQNEKYTGWIFYMGGIPRRLVIENFRLDYIETKCKDFKHAKNTFLKYVKVVPDKRV